MSIGVAAQTNVRVPILLYHNLVSNAHNENPMLSITANNFRSHIMALKNAGYESISLEQFYDFANNGKPLPEKPIIITFDDGYSSNYDYAFPILQEFATKATIFVVTSTVGATNTVNFPHFTWEQAKQMQQSGLIEIQSHSHSHKELALFDIAEIIREIRLSKYLIETNLNKECNFFAYPYGSISESAIQAVWAAGYKVQCQVGDYGYNTVETLSQPLLRITVNGNLSAEELLDMIEQNVQTDLY